MNDTETVDDTALFNATVTGETPVAEAEPVIEPVAEPRPEPAIPPARLREEADARRAAERDRERAAMVIENRLDGCAQARKSRSAVATSSGASHGAK